jgi:hypothetical protein
MSDAVNQPDTCDSRCAWLMTDSDEPYMHACAIAVIASRTGEQSDGSANTYVIKNEVTK